MKFVKYVPWAICAVLVILLGFVYFSKNAEIESLQSQYDMLVAESNKKIDEANQQRQQLINEANKKLEEANQQQQQLVNKATELLAAASLPEATVTVGFRPAMLGSGFVARITNTSGISTPFSIEINRSSTGNSRNYERVLNGGSFIEIGHREGWAFVSGDSITINQPNHKPKAVTLQ